MKRTVKVAQSFGVVIPVIAIVACVTTAIIAQEEQQQAPTTKTPVKQPAAQLEETEN